MKKPTWNIEDVIRDGTRLGDLTITHRARLEPRLEAGAIDGFIADHASLRDAVTGASKSRTIKVAKTQTQDELAADAISLVMTHRDALKAVYPARSDTLTLFGVGQKVLPGKIATVVTALEIMADAADKHPELARAAGILPEDVVEMRTVKNALVGADTDQEKHKGTAKASTAARNACHLRVESAMRKIVGIAGIVFRKEPQIAQAFRDCLPTVTRAKKKKEPAATAA
ncbi:MAG: hypothetical protein ACOX6T_11835 [Myxococcales bacterium]|jgi:hypothetical protein